VNEERSARSDTADCSELKHVLVGCLAMDPDVFGTRAATTPMHLDLFNCAVLHFFIHSAIYRAFLRASLPLVNRQ
jgi:hypothetical protein